MNWQDRWKWLSIFSVILIGLSSCDKDYLTIGIPSENKALGAKYFELQPESYTIWVDSIRTLSTSKLLVGRYSDAYFGEVEAKSYFMVVSSGTNGIYDSLNFAIDSAELVIYWDTFYGNTIGSTHQWNLSLLDTAYRTSETSHAYTFLEKDIDSLVWNIEANISTEFGENLNYDSLIVDLGTVYPEQIFTMIEDLNYEKLKDPDISIWYVNQLLPGFVLEADPSNEGVIGINNFKMNLYFSKEGDTGARLISFSPAPTKHNYISPNKVNSNRTGTPLEGLNSFRNRYDSPDGNVFYQAGTGVRPVFDFESLKTFKEDQNNLEHVVVTHAFLEINNADLVSEYLARPVGFELLLTDETNKNFFNRYEYPRKVYANISSDSASSANINASTQNSYSPLALIYNEEKNNFQVDLSLYIQGIIDGNTDLYRLLLNNSSIDANSLRQLVINQSDVKLKIFYNTRE